MGRMSTAVVIHLTADDGISRLRTHRTPRPFVVIDLGGSVLYVHTSERAKELAASATRAADFLRGEGR